MKHLIDLLCSDACAGRRPGTPGGTLARSHVIAAFRDAGLDPFEQPVPGCRGANVLATIPGDVDRWVLVGAHFDHLGSYGGQIFRGADDNAAAVAVLVEVGRALAADRSGRGVILAAFDGEEPPHFCTDSMGSRVFVKANRLPIDFMVCMDLVGHRFGPASVPDEVGASLFALGSERSSGTYDLVMDMKRAEPGVIVRPADAGIVPPLSDYEAFWEQRIPFLFLSAGRSRVYHTPEDTPELLDLGKLAATARWLTRFVRRTRRRDLPQFADVMLDRGTLDEVREIVDALVPFTPAASAALRHVDDLRKGCDRVGNLPPILRGEVAGLVGMLEAHLE